MVGLHKEVRIKLAVDRAPIALRAPWRRVTVEFARAGKQQCIGRWSVRVANWLGTNVEAESGREACVDCSEGGPARC